LLLSLIALYIQIKERISVATIANISYVLTYYQWNGFGLSDITWTILMMIVATRLAIVFIFREKDWAFPLVIV
jgi:benzodiazapine receptor